MRTEYIILIICQFSAIILKRTAEQYKGKLENNADKLSPKQKLTYNRKIQTAKIFRYILQYGSFVYIILFLIVKFYQLYNG